MSAQDNKQQAEAAYRAFSDGDAAGAMANMDDVSAFKLALQHASEDADLFQDYQGLFPAEFTTYDALHPNLYGARLHAFDMVNRLNETGLLAGMR